MIEEFRKLIKIGIVAEVDYEKATCKVVFRDKDETQSKDLKVVFTKTKKNQSWDMPDLEEQVVCLFLPNGSEEGFVIGSVYSEKNKGPAIDNRQKYLFEDGTYFEYDKTTSTAKLYCVGNAVVESNKNISCIAKENIVATATKNIEAHATKDLIGTCDNANITSITSITLKAPSITLDGEVSTTKNIVATENISAGINLIATIDCKTAKGSVNGHIHTDSRGGKTTPMN